MMGVSVTFDFDSSEYYRALRQAWRYNPARRLSLILGFGVPAVMGWLLVVRTWGEVPFSTAFWNVLPWLVLGGFYLALMPLMLKSAARKAPENDPALRGPQTRSVGPAGIQVKGAGFTQDFGWNDLVRVLETAEFFLFFYNKSVGHYLPKRALAPAEADQIRDLVRANLPERGLVQPRRRSSA
jgi:hypothetical protein